MALLDLLLPCAAGEVAAKPTEGAHHRADAPSTLLRRVTLPRFAGEETTTGGYSL